MGKGPKLTLIGLIVIICVIAFWILILFPFLEKVRRIEMRTVCGTNLKGLGTAVAVYANDYKDNFPQLPGVGPWSKRLGFDYDHTKPDFSIGGAEEKVSRTITASLYLLVRNCDVDPNVFICPFSGPEDFKGDNPLNLPIDALWDFGFDPYKHVSYSYHNPYGMYPANGSRSAAFVVMADMSPWFKDGNIVPPGKDNRPPQVIEIPPDLLNQNSLEPRDENLWRRIVVLCKTANSLNHIPYNGPFEEKAEYSVGQNVLFADGHNSWETQPNVGVKNDNIYTFWSVEENPTDQDRQGGTAPTSRSPENDAKSVEDSFLAI